MAHIIGEVGPAGSVVTISTPGGVVTGINNGGTAGISVGSTTYYPT